MTSPEPVILLLLAVLFGITALFFQKFMIIVPTGFGGAWSVVTGLAGFVTGTINPAGLERLLQTGGSHLYVILLCWILPGLSGVMVQYKSAQAKESQARLPGG